MTVVGGPAFITSTQSNSHMRSVKILFIYTAILPTTQHDMFPSYWQTHWVLEVNVIASCGANYRYRVHQSYKRGWLVLLNDVTYLNQQHRLHLLDDIKTNHDGVSLKYHVHKIISKRSKLLEIWSNKLKFNTQVIIQFEELTFERLNCKLKHNSFL